MLDAFIIEQLRRREQHKESQVEQRSRLDLPVPAPYEAPSTDVSQSHRDDDTDYERGVVVVEF